MLHYLKNIFFLFFVFFFTESMSLESDWSISSESQVRLISPLTKNNDLNDLYIGLEYKLNKDWKTYWKSPGEGGFPQEVDWSNSKNVKSLEIKWPIPEYFQILDINSIGYKENIIFPIHIVLENPLSSTSIILNINYLTCKDICIPGRAYLELFIPAGKAKTTQHLYNFEKALSKLPNEFNESSFVKNVEANIYSDRDYVSFQFKLEAKDIFYDPKIFLHTKLGLPVIEPQISINPSSKTIMSNFIFDKKLVSKNNIYAEFTVVDKNNSFVFNENLSMENKNIYSGNTYFLIILISLLGGLILNFMPCVLPVLSIKLLSILKNTSQLSSIRLSFINTSLGIVFSYVLLGISMILLRELGVSIGWGIQFQQPLFLMIIGFILSVFSFNLFGLYNFNTPKFLNNNIIIKLQENNFGRDFFIGFFATIMATPCSAPFLGTALTFAFTQSSLVMISIFIFLGIGMALPYILVAFFPKILKLLPKPGKWMIYLKYFLGFLLLLTLLWIGSILLKHFNYFFIIFSIFLFLFTLILLKFLKYSNFILIISGLVFFCLPLFFSFNQYPAKEFTDWKDISSTNIEKLVNENEIVFVDITADWCTTCQFNKINVLNKKTIKELFVKNNVIKVRGDWTKPNDSIEKFLQQNQRFGIPFNIIYSKKYPDGMILSELLSEEEIFKKFEKIKSNF